MRDFVMTAALTGALLSPAAAASRPDPAALRGKVMAGYQGWFRCPGDAAGLGWLHWSHEKGRLTSETVSFEVWPDVSEYHPKDRCPVPDIKHADGRPAELFTSDSRRTVRRHFEWMRDYGIDGAWLQHFLVDLPEGTNPDRYATRMRVVGHVRAAARRTGRVWALAYDIAGMPPDRIYDALTADWKRMVDGGVVADRRYVRQDGRPVVLIWGFYHQDARNLMTPQLANRLIDFFKASGPYAAFLVGGGKWDWRGIPDASWRAFYERFDGYAPWNVGNFMLDGRGVKHAAMHAWKEDKREAAARGALWIPVIYPGFGWNNLKRGRDDASFIPRREGQFLWEQFYYLRKLGADSAYLAMFDEADEGTALFKLNDSPPSPGGFIGDEGLPNDWYLRLTQAGIRMLRGGLPPTPQIPLRQRGSKAGFNAGQ